MNPKVSFIVPCYKLAHYLNECVDSILRQTYKDFEILIMDDCSPDNTRDVALAINDPRVHYIRNEPNLGNIRNFNKGIGLAKGEYLWLISADDFLKANYVLQKYVDLLEAHPKMGYVFCPIMTFAENRETGAADWTTWPGKNDRVLSGREVIKQSAYRCPVAAPAGLVRKRCYELAGDFPIKLTRTADYYLWAVFAILGDVGYFAEPMVAYRLHTTNMEKEFVENKPALFYEQETLVRWSIKKEVEKAGITAFSQDYRQGLASEYIARIVRSQVENSAIGTNLENVLEEIKSHTYDVEESEELIRLIRNSLPAALSQGYRLSGLKNYQLGSLDRSAAAFRSSLTYTPWRLQSRVFLSLIWLEKSFGIALIPFFRRLKSGHFVNFGR